MRCQVPNKGQPRALVAREAGDALECFLPLDAEDDDVDHAAN